jgi:hypothetical protein
MFKALRSVKLKINSKLRREANLVRNDTGMLKNVFW